MNKSRLSASISGFLAWAGLGLALALAAPESHAQAKKNVARVTAEKNAPRQDLSLAVGRALTVDLGFTPCTPIDKCVMVANGTLLGVEYSAQKKQLVFTPAKKGETTVTARDDKGDIRVIFDVVISDTNLDRRVSEIRELLRDIEGIEIKIMGDKIVVDGEVVVMSDLARLYAVLGDESYKGLVLNLVTVSPVGLQLMADRIQQEINRSEIKVRVLNSYFVLEGQVQSEGERAGVEKIARNMLQGFVMPVYDTDLRAPIQAQKPKVIDPIVNNITVAPAKPPAPEKMLRVTVDFVELSKDYLRNFGFTWIPSLEAGGGSVSFGQSTTGGVTTQGNGSLSGTIGNLFPKLGSAQEAGYARVLEESILIVKSGQKAVFERKLELPLKVQGANGQIDYRMQEIGPGITITPKVVGQTEDIDLSMDFYYAGFGGQAGDGAAIVQKHNYQTAIVVKSGESAAIVNAISNVVSTTFNKPGVAEPANPLFRLIRSKNFQKSKSQFVVFVTPQIIETTQGGTEDIKQKYGMKRKLQ